MLRTVKLVDIPILKKLIPLKKGSATNNDVLEFYETLPSDRVVEIDECNLYLFGGGNYFSITPEMIDSQNTLARDY